MSENSIKNPFKLARDAYYRKSRENVYSDLDSLPKGRAGNEITDGILVLEGGGWRGLYTIGALDAMMEENINFQTTIGVSAGALSGIGYLSGQIGWGVRIDLGYRHDPEYCGLGAVVRDHGVTGFSYLFHELLEKYPIDEERFNDPARRFVVTATDCLTGEQAYFERGKCPIFRAIQASATVPYVSRPVVIGGRPYLDGGLAEKIPYDWAVSQSPEKLMVIRTRHKGFRKEEKGENAFSRFLYRNYPALLEDMETSAVRYNRLLDRIEKDDADGKIFMLAPSEPVTVSRFEGDMEKLGALYWRGYNDAKSALPGLKSWLQKG